MMKASAHGLIEKMVKDHKAHKEVVCTICHFFKTKDRSPYSYLSKSEAPSAGKYKPKFTEIEKKSFAFEMKEEPDKSSVKVSTKV